MGKKHKKNRNPLPYRTVSQPTPRQIQLRDIPRELQPLAVRITKLEDALMTYRKSILMNFDHLIDLLVDLKKDSMSLIQQAKIVQKVEKKEEKKG